MYLRESVRRAVVVGAGMASESLKLPLHGVPQAACREQCWDSQHCSRLAARRAEAA